ncbi:DNA polymerase III subunit alpha [Bacillus massiliigorillae]|uniref:DNA polymerase III subunit alpha n=1 Tax=Bacillus massiliigorillae TaxID=1243664 RepID=UPI0003A525AE|nr:DNA polymerase III subunit alpha [Bacillus massiliigorillae]
MDFVHLHVQSSYSLLASTVKIEELVQRAKIDKMHSLALTDRNVMYGVIPFYKACKKNGIKPIIGMLTDVLHEEEPFPLLLLAKNQKGYSNLLKISSSIQTKSKQGLPLRWLKGYREGIIAISPGSEGIIETHIREGNKDQAVSALQTFKEIFGSDSFYLSLQNMNQFDEEIALQQIIQFANETETEVVATNPVMYMEESDGLAYDVLRALEIGVKLSEEETKSKREHYFKSITEMNEAFQKYPQSLQNSVQIAEKCNVMIEFHRRLLPKYPTDQPANELLKQLCLEGFKLRYPNASTSYQKRLQYELSVINKMNFSDYFLIVWDFMKFARQQKILTGPGRGSAAGSMVAYVLQITDIDPMKHNLLFERFLNPERISMPDIDIDFSDIRRDEVIAYVAKKYGDVHVAQIITFGTFATKASLRDTGRVFGLNSKELDALSKMVPHRLGITIEEALQESHTLKRFYEENEMNKKLIDTAMKIEGLPRHTSTHAAGVIISDVPLTEIIAIQEGHNDVHLTQFPMESLEELGLLKMDFLGLRNLTLMERVLTSIRKRTGKSFDIKSIPMDDPQTFQMLGKGETTGIFQFESEGMQNVLIQLKPEQFTDLVAVNALYRPGPMENIPTYIRRRHGEEKITYLHQDLQSILQNTYGIIVYQEQIMQIASKFAGFSLGQADLLRRAVSKKKGDVLEEQRYYFVQGSLKQGYPQDIAEQIYDYIVKFANYGFNLSHAAAYSYIAYQLAYLKAHYPQFFMASLMSSAIGNDSKIAQYAREFKKMDLLLLVPSINKSEYAFISEVDGIRYSLAAIKGVGGTAVRDILQARRDKKFSDLFDFCMRVSSKAVNRKVLEALIHAGAFDEWGEDRATLLASLDVALDHADLVAGDGAGLDLFLDSEFNLKPKYVEVEPMPIETKLLFEKEVLGLYLSDHPVATYSYLFNYFGAQMLSQVKRGKESKYAVGVYITEEKTIRTKKGEVMAFLTITDEIDEMEAVVFPLVYKKYAQLIQKNHIVMMHGAVESRNGKQQFVVQDVFSVEYLQEMKETTVETLYIKVVASKHTKEHLLAIKNTLKKYKGSTRVMLYFEKENRTMLLSMWDWVKPADSLIMQLNRLIGEKNVIMKKI